MTVIIASATVLCGMELVLGGCSTSGAASSSPIVSMTGRPGAVSLAVLRSGLENPAEFRRVMGDALRALCMRGDGILGAAQFQSLDAPGVFGDLVMWRSPDDAGRAAAWAVGSSACRTYFDSTAEDYTFGHVTDRGGDAPLPVPALAEGQVLSIAHFLASDADAARTLESIAAELRLSPGCAYAASGALRGDSVGGLVLMALWTGEDAARAGHGRALSLAPLKLHHSGVYHVLEVFRAEGLLSQERVR
jgi:hypothetical protein